MGGRPGPTQRPEDQREEGWGRVEAVVGVSVIDAAAEWSLRHAYTGTETKARPGGLGGVGGNQRLRGVGVGSEWIAGDDIGGSSLLNRLQEESGECLK